MMGRKIFSSNDVAGLVMKVIGEIEPVGETHADGQRFINLQTLLNTLDILIEEVVFVVPNINCNEYSMQKAGREAYDWIKEKYELFGNYTRGDGE